MFTHPSLDCRQCWVAECEMSWLGIVLSLASNKSNHAMSATTAQMVWSRNGFDFQKKKTRSQTWNLLSFKCLASPLLVIRYRKKHVARIRASLNVCFYQGKWCVHLTRTQACWSFLFLKNSTGTIKRLDFPLQTEQSVAKKQHFVTHQQFPCLFL